MLEWIAPLVTAAGFAGTLATTLIGLARIQNERAKLAAEARKIDAEADRVSIDTGLEGARVIKDISEAAALLVVPYRTENAELRRRIELIESEMAGLRKSLVEQDEALRLERIRHEDRTRLLIAEYEEKIRILAKDIS